MNQNCFHATEVTYRLALSCFHQPTMRGCHELCASYSQAMQHCTHQTMTNLKPQRPKTSKKGTLCFASLRFCAHEQHCTHQMKTQKAKMLLRSQAVQHWHERRCQALAQLMDLGMDQAVQHWHCFRRVRTTQYRSDVTVYSRGMHGLCSPAHIR